MKSISIALVLLSLALGAHSILAQSSPTAADTGSTAEAIDWHALEVRGSSTQLPPLSATATPLDSSFRTGLARHGLALRMISWVNDFRNVRNAAVPAGQQSYVGQRATWSVMANPILTYDLRTLGLPHAQLFAAGTLIKTNWEPNGPTAAALHSLYLFDSLANGKVELMAGYLPNDWEFIGLMVGGSVSSGAQGVYAVLPFENGLAHFQLTAPAFNAKLNLPGSTYIKAGLQRSLDPAGGTATINRNHTGFRFAPKGDKMLSITEVGLKLEPSANSRSTWVRAGYLYNTSAFHNFRTGGSSSGNSTAYLLADHQLMQGTSGPASGLFAGVSAMSNPSSMNPYARYYELRLYQKGPFRSRPADQASLVTSYTSFSPDYLRQLATQGSTYWRNSSTLSASYNALLRRGYYLSLGLTYNSAPAITPRVAPALVPFGQLMCFF